jgi:hypothetical protein
MKNIFLFSVLIAMSVPTYSQPTARKAYTAFIYTSNTHKVKGILYDVQDSTVILVVNYTYVNISYQSIVGIDIRKKGSPGRGVAIGAVTGGFTTLIVVLLGTSSTDSYLSNIFSGPDWAIATAMGTITGAIIGGIAGTALKKYIFIGRDLARFQYQADLIRSYSVAGNHPSNSQ